MQNKRALTWASVLTVAAGFLFLAMNSSILLAHDRYDWGRWGGGYAYEQGQRTGYEHGLRHGLADRRAGVGFDYRNRDYRKARAGYERRYGDRHEYERGFRMGYEAGYKEGYHGYRGDYRRDWPRRRW